jgi:hypothetical protein
MAQVKPTLLSKAGGVKMQNPIFRAISVETTVYCTVNAAIRRKIGMVRKDYEEGESSELVAG